jgi:GNAT superfamily N-acetyltransferase
VTPAGPELAPPPGTPWPAWPGGRILVRQAGGGDLGGLRDFLAGLSAQTRHLRFFAGVPASAGMLRIMAGQRPDADALVATRNGLIIGHAMAVDTAEPTGAAATEIGVVVADAWQGQGVGSGLIRALAARAQDRGATTLLMEVMAENRRVLAMIAGRWPDARHDRSGPYVTVCARLG